MNPYKNLIKNTDQKVKNLFSDLTFIDESGEGYDIPCLWANPCKLQQFVFQKSIGESVVKDVIRLPIIGVYSERIGLSYDEDLNLPKDYPQPVVIFYTANSWSMFAEQNNQIIEQVLYKIAKPLEIPQGDGYSTEVWFDDIRINQENNSKNDSGFKVNLNRFSLVAKLFAKKTQNTEEKPPF